MNFHNQQNEQSNQRNYDEMVHSESYQLFMLQKDSNDYATKREGYREDLLSTIFPEEREAVESIIVLQFKLQDIAVLKFMNDLTSVDGLSIVEEQYRKWSKNVIDAPNLARYLYLHTKKQMYLEDLMEYCLDEKRNHREEALRSLSEVVMDLERDEIPQIYEISQLILVKENDSELLFWAKAIMRKCLNQLGKEEEY